MCPEQLARAADQLHLSIKDTVVHERRVGAGREFLAGLIRRVNHAGGLADGDVFLLCSDGLTEHVEDHEMAEALTRFAPQAACDALVQLTLQRGARDNVTVVVVRVSAARAWQ